MAYIPMPPLHTKNSKRASGGGGGYFYAPSVATCLQILLHFIVFQTMSNFPSCNCQYANTSGNLHSYDRGKNSIVSARYWHLCLTAATVPNGMGG